MNCLRRVLVTLVAVGWVGATLPAGATTCTWKGGTGDWSLGSNWTNGTPLSGDTAIINAGTILIDGATPDLGSFTLNGGTLTFSNWTTQIKATNVNINGGSVGLPPAFTTSQMSNRVWFACTNFFLASGGAKIDVLGKGYTTGYGPGKGGSRSGSGYGGYGGNFGTGGGTYGSMTAPTDPGSGAVDGTAGQGGGAVLIEAPAGTVTVNGTITANGADGGGSYYGGGSGGSIYITCYKLSGTNGLMTADGGQASSGSAGDGGGGRIAVIYNPTAQTNAGVPGVRFSVKGITVNYPADIGTLYFPDSQFVTSPLIHSGQWMAPGATNFTFNSLWISNAWFRFTQDGTRITVSNNLLIDGASARLEIGPNALLSGVKRDVIPYRLFYFNVLQNPALYVGDSLIMTNSGKFYIYAGPTNAYTPDYGALVSVTNDIILNSGCRIYAISNPTNGGSPLFVARNMQVLSSAAVNADGMGFSCGATGSSYGPGAGGYRAGAGYGGFGGNYGDVGGGTYGLVSAPDTPGSAGGYGQNLGDGSCGGGLVRVQASGTVTINGTVTANGADAGNDWRGSGSGGGINITCNLLVGNNGTVTAKGGTSTGSNGNGGGGRIAVNYNPSTQAANPVPTIQFSAAGGVGNAAFSADLGSLYFPDNRLLTETVTHSGQWLAPAASWSPNTLTVSNGWFRFAADGFNLTVTNDVLITGSSGRLELGGGSFLTNKYFKDANNIRFIYSGNSPALNCGGNLVLTNSGSLYVYSGNTNGPTPGYGSFVGVTGNLVIANGSWIYPISNPTNGGSVFFQAGNVIISTNAGFNADAGGYAGMSSVGAAGFGPGRARAGRAGGGYGGKGGYDASNYGDTYGSSNAPAQCGGGGGNFGAAYGGTGGGLVWLQAANILQVDGTIRANGIGAVGGQFGGGSGGGIYLTGQRYSGGPNGSLQAIGGTLGGAGGGGGGGRIAVWRVLSRSGSYQGTYSVTNGAGGAPAATVGSLVVGNLPEPAGLFLILR